MWSAPTLRLELSQAIRSPGRASAMLATGGAGAGLVGGEPRQLDAEGLRRPTAPARSSRRRARGRCRPRRRAGRASRVASATTASPVTGRCRRRRSAGAYRSCARAPVERGAPENAATADGGRRARAAGRAGPGSAEIRAVTSVMLMRRTSSWCRRARSQRAATRSSTSTRLATQRARHGASLGAALEQQLDGGEPGRVALPVRARGGGDGGGRRRARRSRRDDLGRERRRPRGVPVAKPAGRSPPGRSRSRAGAATASTTAARLALVGRGAGQAEAAVLLADATDARDGAHPGVGVVVRCAGHQATSSLQRLPGVGERACCRPCPGAGSRRCAGIRAERDVGVGVGARRRTRRSRPARAPSGARPAAGAAAWRRPAAPASVTAPVTREIDSSTSMLGKCPAVASRRDSTTWPSRIERAVSPIGSCMSSPSTSTV